MTCTSVSFEVGGWKMIVGGCAEAIGSDLCVRWVCDSSDV